MRPVDKGSSPKVYRAYQDARDDLLERLGTYCSYCEMSIKNMPEVEHVIPRVNGGAELEWENFLLSCKYCNTSKSDHNQNRSDYLWPDEADTFKVFQYEPHHPIKVSSAIIGDEHIKAQNTIDLMKLDRQPGSANWSNHKDTRYKSRANAWGMAMDAYEDLKKVRDDEYVMKWICQSAIECGHFSIWMEVFKTHIKMRELLVDSFKGTNKDYFSLT